MSDPMADYYRQFNSILGKIVKGEPITDPRDPDYSRPGIFASHNCSKCQDGKLPCPKGGPHRCDYPHARND